MPHFIRPKLLSNICITVHDKNATEPENDENKKFENETVNKSTPKICKTLQNKTKCNTHKTAEMIVELSTNNRKSYDKPLAISPEKQNGKLLSQPQHETTQQKPQLNTLPELKEVQSFGSVDLIPVSNATKQDPKVHEKPVKNFVEITPLIRGQNENSSTKPEKSTDVPAQPKLTICIEGKSKYTINKMRSILLLVKTSNKSK